VSGYCPRSCSGSAGRFVTCHLGGSIWNRYTVWYHGFFRYMLWIQRDSLTEYWSSCNTPVTWRLISTFWTGCVKLVAEAALRTAHTSVSQTVRNYCVRQREWDGVLCNPQEGFLRVNKCRRTMAGVPVLPYQQFWADKRASLERVEGEGEGTAICIKIAREGERIFDLGVPQLSAGGRREGTSRQLPRL
jgi:hypothetical protein